MPATWQAFTSNLSLSHQHIDIWRTSLDLPALKIHEYFELLDSDEKQRVENYRSEKRRNEFIITRGLLRKIISGLFHVEPQSVDFLYTDKDKPYLEPSTLGVPLSFNISHSHECAVIAMGLDRIIGIDIEKIRPDVEFTKLAQRFFSSSESAALGNSKEEELPAAFFSCWSRKEAFVKALGDGLSFGLGEFTVSITPGNDRVGLKTDYNPDDAGNWRIVSIDTRPGYATAVCSNQTNYKLRYWEAG